MADPGRFRRKEASICAAAGWSPITMLADPIRSIWVRASPRRLLTFSGARYLLAELLEVKGMQDWGEAMNYDPVRNVHAVDIMKPAGESPGDFTGEAIERRLDYGYRQMRGYLDSLPPAASG
jgi:hypothetical protein